MNAIVAIIVTIATWFTPAPTWGRASCPEWMIDGGMAWLHAMPAGLHYEPFADPALVMAVIARESYGNPDNRGPDGEVGLMAVIERPWTLPGLENPVINIQQGSHMLVNVVLDADWDVATGLAAYNCGWTSLVGGRCIPSGGYAYAERVLDCLPGFRARLDVRAGTGDYMGRWLCSRGYGTERVCGYLFSREPDERGLSP